MSTTAQLDAVSRLVRESVRRVDAIAPDALRALLPSLRAARDELRSDLREWLDTAPGATERFTAYQRAQALRALEGSLERIEELQPAMAGALGVGRKETGVISAANLDTEVQRLSSIFGGGIPMTPNLNTAAIIAKGDQLLWKRHENSARRYAGGIGDDLRHQLALGVAKGETFEQMVNRMRRLAPGVRAAAGWNTGEASATIADSMFHRWRHHADRLIRTENMHAYNVQHDLAITALNEDRDEDEEEWLRRWDASADKVTCDRCKALDRTVAKIGGEFRWGYKCPPAHPYCRCVILAWLARWGGIKGEIPSKDDEGKDIAPKEPKPSLPPESKPKRGKLAPDTGSTTIAESGWEAKSAPSGSSWRTKTLTADHGDITDEKGRRIGGRATIQRFDSDGEYRVSVSSARDGERFGSGARSKIFKDEAAALEHARAQLEKQGKELRRKIAPAEPTPSDLPPVWEKKKNPKRQAAAQKAAAASVERRREIHGAVTSNLPQELQVAWSKEGHKFMQDNAHRTKGIEDPINAASKISEAFAEQYGSGAETIRGNEGDRFYKRAEIEAKHAEEWADEQERKHYEAAHAAMLRDGEIDERGELTPRGRARDRDTPAVSKADDDDPPF